ncbi:peroxisome proliferator-activated receptor gamma coactivator-related protein 1 [Amia ocellicauda]|uniref:peroxisome proliferator-activated receptor gamma coactivator-related protein 1 n=1 Tax=Amia ocellicauda TaxID=2972642 RepID=UPI0034638918
MAARWGAGEETLTAGNMAFFTTYALDESEVLEGALSCDDLHDLSLSTLDVNQLDDSEGLESLSSCLDPTILSILEDSAVTGEIKNRLDEESEATLLTALTEILDNVDDENLSPFDTLPDSELLAGQREREQSPLRRFLSLARSPPERESLNLRGPKSVSSSSAGKVESVVPDLQWSSFLEGLGRPREESSQGRPRVPRLGGEARSDGEEEEGDTAASSPMQGSDIDSDALSPGMADLGLSLTLEPGTDCVSLSDLVKHMHPYCLTVCLEPGTESEPMLLDGGLVLEVVDQGEQGEPVLALRDVSYLSEEGGLPLAEQEEVQVEEKPALEEEEEKKKEEEVGETSSPVEGSPMVSEQEEKIPDGQPRQENSEKRPSRRKKKRKNKEGGRDKSKRRVAKEEEDGKPTENLGEAKLPDAVAPTASESTALQVQCDNLTGNGHHALKVQADVQLTTRASSVPETPKNPTEMLPSSQPQCTPEAKIASLGSDSPAPTTTKALPKEPKPRMLSLEQYRQLRQKRQPTPVDKKKDPRIRWPTLPEPPKELPPIPCLPQPVPAPVQRRAAAPTPAPVPMPAWQPIGPGAPPTPQALLIPPGTVVAQSKPPAPAPLAKPTCTSPPESSPVPLKLTNNPPPVISPLKPPVAAAPQNPATVTSSTAPRSPPLLQGRPAHCDKTTPLKRAAGPAACGLSEIHSASRQSPAVPLPVHPGKAPQQAALSRPPSQCQPVPQNTTKSLKPLPVSCNINPTMPSQTLPLVAPAIQPAKSLVLTATPVPALSTAPPRPPPTLPLPVTPSQESGPKLKPCALPALAQPPPSRKKSPAADLIQSFTSEIGIEAPDLTSLLEQFEETQAKEQQSVPEVCGRAAAVGNSSVDIQPDRKLLERPRVPDLASTAGLTPPATPPHQMWKPLVPVALLGKPKAAEVPRPSPTKAIQIIEPRPLPNVKTRHKLPVAVAPQAPSTAAAPLEAYADHDYCLPQQQSEAKDMGTRWNVKQQASITIKPIERGQAPAPARFPPASQRSTIRPPMVATPSTSPKKFVSQPLDHRTPSEPSTLTGSVLLSPDTSPYRVEADTAPSQQCLGNRTFRYYERPPPSPERGRPKRRYRTHSPSSDSSSSGSDSDSDSCSSQSRSRSPPRKRYRCRRSQSRSSSSSLSSSRSRSCSRSRSRSRPRRRRFSYSSSRSGSWSRSRSRSQSPCQLRARWGGRRRSRSPGYSHHSRYDSKDRQEIRNQRKEKAIEERRVVYIGRIRGGMTRKELKERFSKYGDIEECTLHFREHGDNYGFVTYHHTDDAFSAIENGNKLRQPDELPFDLCFGGRRQFCKTSYADLDSNRDYDPTPMKSKFDALDFDTLLKQAQKGLRR